MRSEKSSSENGWSPSRDHADRRRPRRAARLATSAVLVAALVGGAGVAVAQSSDAPSDGRGTGAAQP
ncbi:MAG: hypothetical protein ACRDVE_15825, partial [Actinocrinis sp.]